MSTIRNFLHVKNEVFISLVCLWCLLAIYYTYTHIPALWFVCGFLFFDMSDECNLKNCEEFKLVKYKRSSSKSKQIRLNLSSILTNKVIFNKESIIRRISDAKSEITTTDVYDSITASLREGLDLLKNPHLSEIICYGLGNITESITSRYQLALLLALKDYYKIPKVSVYDPIFDQNDIECLKNFDIVVIKNNTEAKNRIGNNIDNKAVLFYLPHCPKQLSNNLLWANWGLNLKRCVIISNSFNSIIENNSTKKLKETAQYILKISPYCLELPVINSFKYYEIFNDTAVHFFPKLNIVTEDFWSDNIEPVYSDDIEFVTKDLSNLRIKT